MLGNDMDSSRNGQPILLLWLNLLGWQIEVERDGDNLVGIARHLTADGSSVRVGGCARTRDELAFQLFQAAMKIVDAGRQHPRPSLAA
jgi:hypothetical protein